MNKGVRPVLFFLFLMAFKPAACFIHESVRIRALGSEFTGLIPDAYTDVFRNPAYLANWDKAAFMVEVQNSRNQTLLSSLAIPTKFANLAISYQVNGHPTGFSPSDGRQFNGQRVTSDVFPLLKYSSAREFQIIKAIVSKPIGSLNIGLDIQYLRDWLFEGLTDDSINQAASPDFFGVYYNQLPTAFQIRGGGYYKFKPSWELDVTLRFQRDRPRLEASLSGYKDITYSDSLIFARFRTGGIARSKSLGHMDELETSTFLKFSLNKSLQGAITFSVERTKGMIPFKTTNSDSSNYYYGGNFTGVTDSSIQHFHWVYKTGFSLTKTLQQKVNFSSGIILRVTRTREFINTRIDSSIRIWQNGNLIRNIQKLMTMSGEKGLTFTELSVPFGVELPLKNNFYLRAGIKNFLIVDNPDETDHHGDLTINYSFGFGTNFQEHLFVDTFVEEDLGNLKNWQIALRYVF